MLGCSAPGRKMHPHGDKGGRVSPSDGNRAQARVIRIIKCLRLLQASCYSACDLAGHFRVSRRTVYRDLRLLAHAGVPVVRRTDNGRYYVPDPPPA